MNKTDKNITYITATCKAMENKFLGRERLKRMADAPSEREAYAVLRETSFGGGCDSADPEELLRAEEKDLLDFVREYAPDDGCLSFCLLPYDFYNAEVVVKCLYTGLDTAKFVGAEGLFSVEELTLAAKGEVLPNMPSELSGAMRDAEAALKAGKNGVATGTIFKRAEYSCLINKCKHGYLKEILVRKIDALNVSVCLRSNSSEDASTQLIDGGTLTSGQIAALCYKDETVADEAFSSSPLKEVVIRSIDAAKNFKPLVELEKELNGGAAKRAYDGRYTEQSGIVPFVAYYLMHSYEAACVRIILSGKTNGLDGALITERIKAF